MGTSPERRDRLNCLEIVEIRAATLKKKGSKPSDPDVFCGQVSGALLAPRTQ
jgi:hypothetical protein